MNRLPVVPFFFLALFFAGCAATPAVVDVPPPPPPAPASPLDGFSYVQVTGGSVILGGSSSSGESIPVSGSVGFASTSPNGQSAIVAIGGSLIYVGQESGALNLLHSGSERLRYTVAWSSVGDEVAFGFYEPSGDAMGPGGIRLFNPQTKIVSDVGCSASKAVLSVLGDGSLLVRNDDNLYQVSAEGCNTLRSVDARKLYHVSPSPDGEHIAYILRDLVYNRDTRAYEPDSTLYIELASGSEPVKVIGDKYSPRNLAWSSDGSELMYDVGPADSPGMRAISIYSVSDARSSYLLPPGSVSASHGRFSPDGRHVIYRSNSSDGAYDWMVKTQGAQFSQTLPVDELDVEATSWVDANTFLIPAIQGRSSIVRLASGTPEVEVLEEKLIALWPSR